MARFSWQPKANPDLFIERLNKTRKQLDKNVSFTGGELSYLMPVLHSCLKCPEEIAEDRSMSMLRSSVFIPTKSGKLDLEILLDTVNNEYIKYLKLPIQEYYYVTSFSYRGQAPISWTNCNNCRINFRFKTELFYKNHPETCKTRAEELKHLQLPRQRHNYRPLVVLVKGRVPQDAANYAATAIDEIRGIINLYVNYHQNLRISSGITQPVNRLRQGPIHTLHKRDGSLATTSIWYEPDFVDQSTLLNLDKYQPHLRNFISKSLISIRKSNIGGHIKEGLRRYNRALDRRDWKVSFQELWVTLELLTNTVKNPYDVTIRRAASVYKDYYFYKHLIHHLREYRNIIVHQGTEPTEMETLMYNMKNVVEDVLMFYLHEAYILKTRDQVSQVMDLPVNLASLREKQKLIQFAAKFRK